MGRFGDGDILGRTEQYSLRAIQLFRYLRRQKAEDGWVVGRQLLRSATSVGANLVEADAAETRKDFVHKCRLALKEARESGYWLRLLLLAEIVESHRLASLLSETEQLISILVRIIVNTKDRVAQRESQD